MTIYASNKFVVGNGTTTQNMFRYASNLVGGEGTTFNSSYIDGSYARIDDPTNGKPGYFSLRP